MKCDLGYFIIFLLQDFVWAFGQVLAGAVTISLPILYGVSKFREDLVNQVCSHGASSFSIL